MDGIGDGEEQREDERRKWKIRTGPDIYSNDDSTVLGTQTTPHPDTPVRRPHVDHPSLQHLICSFVRSGMYIYVPVLI